MKNKFCPACREEVRVPIERVRALTPELQPLFANNMRAGFWKCAREVGMGVEFRTINGTRTCTGPQLVCFRDESSIPPLEYAPLPEEWVCNVYAGACVRMRRTMKAPARGGKVIELVAATHVPTYRSSYYILLDSRNLKVNVVSAPCWCQDRRAGVSIPKPSAQPDQGWHAVPGHKHTSDSRVSVVFRTKVHV